MVSRLSAANRARADARAGDKVRVQVVGKAVQAGQDGLVAAHQGVVAQHRGNGHRQAACRHHQGLAHRAGNLVEGGLAGGADAESKYLRRWVIDSGSALASRISLSRGIEQRRNDTELTAQTLQATDLLVIDERAWAALAGASKTLIRSAVDEGMGLLLRIGGPLSALTRADWAALGFAIEDADLPRSAYLLDGGGDIEVARLPLRVVADDSVALLSASDASVLARWRAHGQGRIAVWLPLDT